jgi:hypothetical protein
MAVANFYNNSKRISEFVDVNVSKVSGKLESIERMSASINSP